MMELSWKDHLTALGLKKVLDYLDSDPDNNIEKILDWLIRIDKDDKYIGHQAKVARDTLRDPNNNWNRLVKSLWTDIDDGVRKKIFVNFLLYASYLGGKRQQQMRDKYDCNIPWAILLDPTTSCNLRCVGCWAADYPKNISMDFNTLDKIINQGKDMGVYFFLFSGGEPLVRKKDIIELCRKHDDCVFLAFTNGVLIDEDFADAMLEVQNFVPAISIEGTEEATDSRRGKGCYQAVVKAMEILRTKKLPFGISCCYTSQNVDVVGSEQFIDEMIARGAKFAWFFTYMPVGVDAVPELMVTPEQREFMYRQIRAFRETKPIFTLDFWNDGEYVQGCIAGGRRYLHVNANGDIEPCAFIHYSDSNIYSKTLLEALQSPLFKQYQANQPFNDNHLRPCPLLDNYGCLAKMVQNSGAKSTDLQKPEDVLSLTAKCKKAAENWAPVADALWQEKQLKKAL